MNVGWTNGLWRSPAFQLSPYDLFLTILATSSCNDFMMYLIVLLLNRNVVYHHSFKLSEVN